MKTTIYGGRGDNQLLGSDGINVNVITRTITFPTANTSTYPNADPLIAANNLIYGTSPGSAATRTASATTTT